ncbi:MAG TPA: CDP-diacylglycerol--serine O-phosphatidyltransferase, partial [Polyangiaceae bacterium]
GKVKYFEGTPIPTSIGIVLIWAWLLRTGRIGGDIPGGVTSVGSLALHPLSLVYFISGSAMISKTLKIPKL